MPGPTIQVRIAQHLGTVAAQVLGPLYFDPVKRFKQQEVTSKTDGLPTLVLRAATATSVDNDGRIRDQGHRPVAAWEVPATHGSANPELGHQCIALADLAMELPVLRRMRYVNMCPEDSDRSPACLQRRLVCHRVNPGREAANHGHVMLDESTEKLARPSQDIDGFSSRSDDRNPSSACPEQVLVSHDVERVWRELLLKPGERTQQVLDCEGSGSEERTGAFQRRTECHSWDECIDSSTGLRGSPSWPSAILLFAMLTVGQSRSFPSGAA